MTSCHQMEWSTSPIDLSTSAHQAASDDLISGLSGLDLQKQIDQSLPMEGLR
jgi:hypothetical protein